MDTKEDSLHITILQAKEPPEEIEQQISHHIPTKHKLQCGGSTFEIYTHYTLIKNIGMGAYGIVCSGKDTLLSREIAVKKVPNLHIKIPGLFRDIIDAKRVLREIKLLKFFDHHNIVKLLDIILPDNPESFKDMYLVFNLMHTDLSRIIRSNVQLNDTKISWIMYQIVSGLYYMHSADILHRDLKPNNIFINSDCHVKIGDLNLARKQEKDAIINQTDYVVTRWYRAPEVLLSQNDYTQAIDIWSVGCILAELIGRTILFQGNHHQEQIEKIVAVLGKPNKDDLPYEIEKQTREYLDQFPEREPIAWSEIFSQANPVALDLLSHMLVYNPNKRFNIEQCVQHEYFKTHYNQHPPKQCTQIFDWSFDNIDLKEKTIRQALYDEAVNYHKNY